MTALSAALLGVVYEIKWKVCRGCGEELSKEYGLLPGEKIYLLCVYYGGVIIRAKGKKIALGRDMADSIKV